MSSTTRHTAAGTIVAIGADRSRPRTHALLLVVLGVCLAISGVPSALYGTYAAAWHFSSLTTTVVFAAYAAAALLALTVAGPFTDSVGRRPALLLAVGAMIVGQIVFVTAHGVAALLVARAIHGAAIATAVVAAGAALIDIRPADGARAGRLSGIAFSLGMGGGVVGSAALAELLPHPLVTPYVVSGVLVIGLVVGLAVMPETHTSPTRARVRIARPHVPPSIAHDFGFSVVGAAASWVVLGVYLSLFPQLAATETGIHVLVFGGGVVGAMTVTSAVVQWLAQGVPARRMAVIGDAGMAVTMLLSIPLVLSGSAVLVFTAAIVLGAFFGMAFSGSLRHLSQALPSQHRGGVMSAFYLICYSAMGISTVLAGAAATHWTLPQTYAGFAIALAVVCAVAATVGVLGTRTTITAPTEGGADEAVADSLS